MSGKADTLPQSLEELDSQFLLQSANLNTDIRLHTMRSLGGASEIQLVSEDSKDVELAYFHIASIAAMNCSY